MRLQIITLVDVTETREKRDGDTKKYSQQANLNTLFNTATLRTNLRPVSIEQKHGGIAQLALGKKYKDRQKYWIVTLESERAEFGVDEIMLQNDFNLVPITTGLNESVEFPENVFESKNEDYKNVSFIFIDNN
jgi:hypothetical protein